MKAAGQLSFELVRQFWTVSRISLALPLFRKDMTVAKDRDFLIYVVDDEKIIAVTIAAILKKTGFQVLAFTSPTEALESARVNAPDLLLTDVVMPQLSGIDLAIQL